LEDFKDLAEMRTGVDKITGSKEKAEKSALNKELTHFASQQVCDQFIRHCTEVFMINYPVYP
jgi:hypothetical protein